MPNTQIRTGNDGNHVTVYDLAGLIIAVVDERVTQREKIAAGVGRARWLGCFSSNDAGVATIPFEPHKIMGSDANATN